MRKLATVFIFLFLCVINFSCSTHTTIEEGYAILRMQISANSNSPCDQQVKIRVRDAVTQYLSSTLRTASTLSTAKTIVSDGLTALVSIANGVLMENGIKYNAKARLTNQYFHDDCSYDGLTVKRGNYDVLNIVLGQGKGDNWWCVIYPYEIYSRYGKNDVIYKSRFD